MQELLRDALCSQLSFLRKRYVVFSGGGQLGFLILGALHRMEVCAMEMFGIDMHDHINGAAGVSIGACIAFAFLLRIPAEQTRRWFAENYSLDEIVGKINLKDIYYTNGMIDLSFLREKLAGLLALSPLPTISKNITFQEFARTTNKTLRVVVSKILVSSSCSGAEMTPPSPFYQICDCNETPSASVIDTIARSMCLPYIFQPEYEWSNRRQKKYVLFDGGLFNNCPSECFPSEQSFIFCIVPSQLSSSLHVVTADKENQNDSEYNVVRYSVSLLSCIMEDKTSKKIARISSKHVIRLDDNVSSSIVQTVHLTPDEQKMCFYQGQRCFMRYFERHVWYREILFFIGTCLLLAAALCQRFSPTQTQTQTQTQTTAATAAAADRPPPASERYSARWWERRRGRDRTRSSGKGRRKCT